MLLLPSLLLLCDDDAMLVLSLFYLSCDNKVMLVLPLLCLSCDGYLMLLALFFLSCDGDVTIMMLIFDFADSIWIILLRNCAFCCINKFWHTFCWYLRNIYFYNYLIFSNTSSLKKAISFLSDGRNVIFNRFLL